MNLEELQGEIKAFSSTTHGSSNYDQDAYFVKGVLEGEYAPIKYLEKRFPDIDGPLALIKMGMVHDAHELTDLPDFASWYEKQFGKKLSIKNFKKISVLYHPNHKTIFDAIERVNQCFQIFRKEQILLNSKNLPVQLGEWFAKSIFGLKQIKSPSQRGFDFLLDDKLVEIKVEWGDLSSLKGVKVKKSLVELSHYLIIIYLAKNLTIREIAFLESEFVLKKFADKGHTLFIKDPDVAPYSFGKVDRFDNLVGNSRSLMQYASPMFAMKLADRFR